MKSLEGLLLLLSLVAGGVTHSMGALHSNIASAILMSAIVALLAFVGSALISSRLPGAFRPPQGWTAGSLLALGTGEGLGSGVKLLAVGAGLLTCLSMLLFGFWAGFVFIYSFAR